MFIEGGRRPFIEGGRRPFIEGRRLFIEGRRPFIDVVGRKICVGKFKIQHDPMMSEFEQT